MVATLLLSCASVIPLYEEARTDALSDPGVPGARWKPDARMDLSNAVLDDLLSGLVVGTELADAPLDVGVGTMRAHLEIKRFELVPEPRADGALAADLRVAGPISLKTPLGLVEQPVGATARLVATLAVEQRPEGYALVLHAKSLERLELDAKGLVDQALDGTIRDLVLSAVPDYDLAVFSAEDLPIRAMEAERTAAGVSLRIRTAAPDGEPLPELPAAGDDGFRVAVSAASLQQLARRQAFLSDPLQHDIVPEPTSLALSPGGDFVLGLRLWRPVGRGWWRTCEVKGSFEVKNGRVKIRAASVEELDQSKGAAFVDPLMALAEGVVFHAMEKALDVSLPAMRTDKVGGAKAATHVERVDIVGQALVATGDLDVSTRKPRK